MSYLICFAKSKCYTALILFLQSKEMITDSFCLYKNKQTFHIKNLLWFYGKKQMNKQHGRQTKNGFFLKSGQITLICERFAKIVFDRKIGLLM